MNGVRRFIDAVTSPSSAEPPQPFQALFKEKTGPTWPPEDSKPRTSTSSESSPPARPPVITKPTPPAHLITRHAKTPSADEKYSKKDQLLISLLASEAVVDSRDFQILTAEEVDDLKKGQQVLSSRLEASTKKLALETKIRDAAVSLAKVNAAHKKASKQTEEQLESANRRVESAQRDLWRISERSNEVQKKLLEHRAGVLSFSVRSMERKMSPAAGANGYGAYDSGYDTPATSMSPTTSSSSSAAAKPRFDGAHLFAGHADAVAPKRKRSPEELGLLEERLKEATDALTAAGKKQAEMARELQHLRLEKQEVETIMGMDLQSAQDTIAALEKEIPRLEDLDRERKELLEEKKNWQRERDGLFRRAEASSSSAAVKQRLDQMQIEWEADRRAWEKERDEWEQEREDWERERSELQDDKMEDLARLQEEMDTIREDDKLTIQNLTDELANGLAAAKRLVQAHGINSFSRDSSLKGLLAAIGQHMGTLKSKVDAAANSEAEAEAARQKLEEELLSLKESRLLQSPRTPNGGLFPDSGRVLSVLQPLWSTLPSPEARAARFSNQSRYRTGSPTPSSPGPGATNSPTLAPKSLSELDVKSLKALYDSRPSNPPSPNPSSFTIEAFATRVQALIQDDRALIERLIRFAQAHELLKKNAERAQKLAQEANAALETYQKQVRTLEERNMTMAGKQAAMTDESTHLQETIQRLTDEKNDIEAKAAEQAEIVKQLTEANNTLSAKTLALAEEAAAAPEMVRRQMETQLAETRAALDAAQEEIDELRGSEQKQRIALLDELNSMQTENSQLRAQLRAVKR